MLLPLSLALLWAAHTSTALRRHPAPTTKRASATPLEVIQASTPPRRTLSNPSCTQPLLHHTFANSYNTPFTTAYTPPPANCTFTTTILNLTVSAAGQQYDRLATLFLGDVEIWRTSTAMPIAGGIYWTYQKDVSVFDTLLRAEQKIVLDLGNVVDGVLYTGAYDVSLEALYFDDAYPGAGFHPAEQIFPISNLSSAANKSSVFSLPDDHGAVTLSSLPRNIKTAVVSVLASGNGAEEFWYTNVPSAYLATFGAAAESSSLLYGHGPFREVQLLLDGALAGVGWPFPGLFAGGVDPGLWRPVVGMGTFELPSFEVDVTPWVGVLCDGGEHVFELRVVGFDGSATGAVGQNWWVSGALFVWLDEAVNQTIAGEVSSNISAPVFEYLPQLTTTVTNGSVVNESLWVSLSAQRTLSISSTITTANGTRPVSWTQNLSFSNTQNVTNESYDSLLTMNSSGRYSSSLADGQVSEYAYPLNLFSSYFLADTDAELSSVWSAIDRSLVTSGISLLPFASGISVGTEEVATRQNVTSSYFWNATIVGGIEALDTCEGETWYSAAGSPGRESGVEEYSRYLREEDDRMVADAEAWAVMAVPHTQPLDLSGFLNA